MTNYKKAFTLAEIMIVLTVIAVITAVLLPAARHATPDEDVIKFKKAHNTLTTAIRELATSDKYYLDGDMGIKPDGTLIDGTHAGDYMYFCQSIADVLSTRNVSCASNKTASGNEASYVQFEGYNCNKSAIDAAYNAALDQVDTTCRTLAKQVQGTITLNDGVVFYESNPQHPFGISHKSSLYANASSNTEAACRDLLSSTGADPNQCTYATYRLFGGIFTDCYGFNRIYKIFCIDVDGIDSNATETDCVNECPFGYGIRTDGKILVGNRANEWLEKSIQDNEDEYVILEGVGVGGGVTSESLPHY